MIKNIKVNEINDDTRIDRWLKRKFSLTQSFIENKLRRGFIKVNNKKVKSNYKVFDNDIINIYDFLKKDYPHIQKKINIKLIPKEILSYFIKSIIYECSDFLILNKWSGIPTQGTSKSVISVDDIIKKISNNYNLVHRLDKETSGLLIIAKNYKTTKIFGNLFKNQEIDKMYIAICQGVPKNLISIVKLNFNQKSKLKSNVKTITKYNVIKKSGKLSLILFKPLTGKMHQLRIVSRYLQCPIVGDSKYNHNYNYRKEELKLNSFYLKFFFKNQEFEFKSILPKNFISFMKKNHLSVKIDTM